MIPAFVRTCLGDVCKKDKAEFQRLCQEIIDCVSTIQFVRHCQLTSGGHVLLTLKRADVTSTVLNNVMSKTDQYGKSSGGLDAQCVLLNPSVLLSSHDGDQDHLNLDQLRTVLICEHSKELLDANGVVVKSTPDDASHNTVHESELRNIQTRQEICHLFSPSCNTSSKTDTSGTDKDLTRKAKELYKVLKSSKYVIQTDESADSFDDETGNHGNQVINSIQSCSCDNECSCGGDSDLNCDVVLDVQKFLKDNEQFAATGNYKSKVTLSSSLLKDVAKLDPVAKNAENADMVLHVTSCRRRFIQQQVSTVWQMTSTSPLTRKQFYLTHGLVSVHNDEAKIQDGFNAVDLLRIREKQLRESYILKYGDKVEGHGWDISIRQMAVATIKLEILSAAPNSEVKINLCETSREFRQATFVLYNCARLAKLFQNFEENVQKGVYPALPPVNEVDFNLLRDQAEWELTLNFIVAFPSIVKDAVPTTTTKGSQNVTIHTNKICSFLFNLIHKFSSYYGRVHILGESRQHLFPQCLQDFI
ncbi:DALR anticodon-binding domain-containing protein 3 [Desmophyllum pertusum]|uniref:DALR anticodon-binding domain-containing protein 3 n=1 Tax=Desmophyllum pertusum TaxID=174260 RepID=A0A9W9Z9G4_9CNID|nr:DALR anticodon-binding domain-containing protein 3 [Desmophyllum pertusum]